MDGEEQREQHRLQKETQKQRKQVNISPSEVKPLSKQANNDRGAHRREGGWRRCKTTKCLSRLPTPYFVSPHELHKHKQRPLNPALLFEVEQWHVLRSHLLLINAKLKRKEYIRNVRIYHPFDRTELLTIIVCTLTSTALRLIMAEMLLWRFPFVS